MSWQSSAQEYLQRLASAEYEAGVAAHKKKGRKPNTYRHDPSQYHRDLVDLLSKDDEHGFKALKALQGYASALGV
jgi:hypothetical protein